MAAPPPGTRWLPPADEVLAIHRGIGRLRVRRWWWRNRWQHFGDWFAAWVASGKAFWWTIGLTAGVLIATVAGWVAR